MTIGKAELTPRYERWRLREPKDFRESTLRTHDIGRAGYSKRIAGRLMSTNKWQTQAFLIARDEPIAMKRKLRAAVRRQLTRAQQRAMFAKKNRRRR